uniref:Putative secreted peptide n=1 Tax=Anopheles braziliensis TaxID=58242 RepID=A0A2M3ZND6_9DIPT
MLFFAVARFDTLVVSQVPGYDNVIAPFCLSLSLFLSLDQLSLCCVTTTTTVSHRLGAFGEDKALPPSARPCWGGQPVVARGESSKPRRLSFRPRGCKGVDQPRPRWSLR